MQIRIKEDMGDRYADIYTVQIDQDVYTMSTHPRSPNGVNMWIGEAIEIDFGEIEGEEVDFPDLPGEVQMAIYERMGGKR